MNMQVYTIHNGLEKKSSGSPTYDSCPNRLDTEQQLDIRDIPSIVSHLIARSISSHSKLRVWRFGAEGFHSDCSRMMWFQRERV